jgi:hypothetical protein
LKKVVIFIKKQKETKMNTLKTLFDLIVVYIMLALVWVVNAWGYQVLWNDLILNIWQMFSTGDIVNTFRISYGVFFAITVGIGIIYNPHQKDNDKEVSISEACGIIFSKLFGKIISIGIVILVTSIIF